MQPPLTFITGNQHKADFLAKWLGMPVAHRKLDLDEIQSLDLHTVVEYKARQAFALLGTPVLVEDAALTLPAMGRLPGTYIKWFIEELGVEGLCRLANSYSDTTAVGNVCYGFFDGQQMHFFDGEMRGHIAPELRGSGGFGFDPIFVNDGQQQTRGEMDETTHANTSYRTPALTQLRSFLASEGSG